MPYPSYQPTWGNPYLSQNPYQPVAPSQPMTQAPVNGIIKVNGRESAMQYPLPPNSTSYPLIDSGFDGNSGVFYVVSTDGAGMKSIEAFDFTVKKTGMQAAPGDGQFVSRSEFDALRSQVEGLYEMARRSQDVTSEPIPEV